MQEPIGISLQLQSFFTIYLTNAEILHVSISNML